MGAYPSVMICPPIPPVINYQPQTSETQIKDLEEKKANFELKPKEKIDS